MTGCTTDAIPLVGVHSDGFGAAVVNLEAPFTRDGNSLLEAMLAIWIMVVVDTVMEAKGVGNVNSSVVGLGCR